MLVLGGMGSIFGAVAGTIVLSTIPEFLRFASEYRMVTYGIILIVMMISDLRGCLEKSSQRIGELMVNTLLELKNVSMHFGGLKAVDDVSFAVNEGEILSLIGPNGAGKTTVFNVITGVYIPTAGEIFLKMCV